MLKRTVDQIAEELYQRLSGVSASVSLCLFDRETCRRMALQIARIEELKRERGAVVFAHSYVSSEIVYGVADAVGDSYLLAKKAMQVEESEIVFSAVRFMAETAKILNPNKRVLLPATNGGCTLADSISAEEVRELRRQHPEHAFICYINSTAAVKAECDSCVTSGNVYRVVENYPSDKIFFLPDRLMGLNVMEEMKRRGVKKEILTSGGSCYVHEAYDSEMLEYLRLRNPGLEVISHPECTPAVASLSDFVGSTEELIQHVAASPSKKFFMLTECGLNARIQAEFPGKQFIGSCNMCRYMKSNSLDGILRVLENPSSSDEIFVEPEVAQRARRSIEKMFELAEKK